MALGIGNVALGGSGGGAATRLHPLHEDKLVEHDGLGRQEYSPPSDARGLFFQEETRSRRRERECKNETGRNLQERAASRGSKVFSSLTGFLTDKFNCRQSAGALNVICAFGFNLPSKHIYILFIVLRGKNKKIRNKNQYLYLELCHF